MSGSIIRSESEDKEMAYPNYQYPYINKQEVTRVNGRNGAEMYQLAPNSSILMLDETAPIVWLKVTDGAGYATLSPYNITPYEPEKPIDVHSLEERISKLEEALNGKSDNISTQQKPGDKSKP